MKENSAISQEKLILFLQNPSHFPHRPAQVEIVQTHASVLAIASPFVFKIKKHVNLGFLDFRTLAARKRNCEREIHLNSRLCPDLYVATVPIFLRQGELSFMAGGEVVEYALQMKQLPEGFFLNQLVARGQVTESSLEPVLQVLQKFYQQPVNSSLVPYGDIPHLRKNSREVLAPLQSFPADLVPPEAVGVIREGVRDFFRSHKSLLRKRLREGRVIDGHGDLHLDHIHLHEGKVCIYDCIEFNDRFRYLDVAADIAFLVMDLDFHQRPDLAAYVARRFSSLLQDPDLPLLLDYYKGYRACVRAMVEGIRAQQAEVPEAEERKAPTGSGGTCGSPSGTRCSGPGRS